MAAAKEVSKDKYRCCYLKNKAIKIGGVKISEDFKLTKDLKDDDRFMTAFNDALKKGLICPL